ncbi:MAG: hypothetical protein JWM81_106 [Candidatus Saccharibacteria bacterium]|nr:hypothetical protein [Candidatus Saccharibacteria bacterium]
MTLDVQELAPFQTQLENLEAARLRTNSLNTFNNMDVAAQRRNIPKYEKADLAEREATVRLVDDIYAADAEVLSEPQKAIATKVLANFSRGPIPEKVAKINSGFQVFERVQEDVERSRGTVAEIGVRTVSLYESKGAEDIVVRRLHQTAYGGLISVDLNDGVKVSVQPCEHVSFPDPWLEPTSLSIDLLPAGPAEDVASELKRFDPASPMYGQGLIRLGTEAKPGDILDSHLTTDEQRFAARFLTASVQKWQWIHVTPPSESLKNVVVDNMSRIYLELLSDVAPSDELAGGRQRQTPLASYDQDGRRKLFFAADVSASDVELATREKLAMLRISSKASDIAKFLRASQHANTFFEKIAG